MYNYYLLLIILWVEQFSLLHSTLIFPNTATLKFLLRLTYLEIRQIKHSTKPLFYSFIYHYTSICSGVRAPLGRLDIRICSRLGNAYCSTHYTVVFITCFLLKLFISFKLSLMLFINFRLHIESIFYCLRCQNISRSCLLRNYLIWCCHERHGSGRRGT